MPSMAFLSAPSYAKDTFSNVTELSFGVCGADGSGSGLIAKIPSIRCKASETIILFSLINMTFISVTEMMGVKMI